MRQEVVADYLVWRAPGEIQQAIRRNVEAAHAARQESRQLLDAAKRAVEIAVEEGEAAALKFLKRRLTC